MQVVPTSFNPSDYEFLLKSVSEGNHVSKAESLKRFNTLVRTDKKQFAIYAKRIVLSIQQLLTEPKEDINLLACTLTLEIINLNPKEIEYYIRTKLLKNMVRNLGDGKPQIRKTSHYCLLAYVKTYKTFDEIIQIYLHYGLHSDSWQLRQKSINSFQSILMLEVKYLNWSSPEFRKIFQQLLKKVKDQNQYVQKAAELCLLSVCKAEELRNFSKKLPNQVFFAIKEFCQKMKELGHLQEINLYVPEKPQNTMIKNNSFVNSQSVQNKTLTNAAQSLLVLEKVNIKQSDPSPPPVQIASKQALINRIQEIRKKAQTPAKQTFEEKKIPVTPPQEPLKKIQSTTTVITKKKTESTIPKIRKSVELPERRNETEQKIKPDKNEAALGRKLIDDLRNEKDWKVRLEAIEELQNKFNTNKDQAELQSLAKTFLSTLIKLLADSNFKVALIALKIIQQILKIDTINPSLIIPQLVDKITDGKIALRQNISKLIRNQFYRTCNKHWIIQLLNQLKKSPPPNSNIKEEIVNNLSKIFAQSYESEDKQKIHVLSNLMENIVESICPLMDDLKTKIKIKTLDLLVLISVKTQKVEVIKSILSTRLNQVYFQMYIEKMAKQLKNHGFFDQQRGHSAEKKYSKNERNVLLTNRRYSKNPGNSTSTSLKKYSSSLEQHNNTVRTSSFIEKKPIQNEEQKNFDEDSASLRPTRKQVSAQNSKRPILKSFKKKAFDYKSTQYSAVSTNLPLLPPFNDPQKELKLILLEIKSQEWQTCSQALTKLRRIVENHSQLINQSMVKILIPQVMKLVESLRSNLSKNGVITLNEMSNKLRRMLDTELDSIFAKLIKKTLDANSFISEEVRKSLISICSNCNQNRVVTLLINSHTSRAIPIKLAIVNVLQNVVFLPKMYEKELERNVGILVDFLSEGSLEIRQKSKALLSSILCSEKGHQIIRLIPNQHLTKLKRREEVKQVAEKKYQNPEQTERAKQEENFGRKKKKEKITVFPQQFNEIESLLEQCESSDWKVRQQNMTIVAQTLIEPYPRELSQHRLSGRIMDVLSKQISDPNLKVATNALKILQTIPQRIPELIEHNLSVLINEVFNCFGSHKFEIKQLSEDLFEIISNHVEKWMLIQHMCNGALYGLQKSRPTILNRLKEIIPQVYSKGNKKIIFTKNVYPMINKLIEQNKPENMQIVGQLMKTCDIETNGQFLNNLKPKAIQFFNSIKQD